MTYFPYKLFFLIPCFIKIQPGRGGSTRPKEYTFINTLKTIFCHKQYQYLTPEKMGEGTYEVDNSNFWIKFLKDIKEFVFNTSYLLTSHIFVF